MGGTIYCCKAMTQRKARPFVYGCLCASVHLHTRAPCTQTCNRRDLCARVCVYACRVDGTDLSELRGGGWRLEVEGGKWAREANKEKKLRSDAFREIESSLHLLSMQTSMYIINQIYNSKEMRARYFSEDEVE